MRTAGHIEGTRAPRNGGDRDNFRMLCVIRSHLGHLDRFAPALMTAICGCLYFTPLRFTLAFERVHLYLPYL